jgi:hypothetical protein
VPTTGAEQAAPREAAAGALSVIVERAVFGALDVVVLPGAQRPEEGGEAQSAEAERDGDDEEENIHDGLTRRR